MAFIIRGESKGERSPEARAEEELLQLDFRQCRKTSGGYWSCKKLSNTPKDIEGILATDDLEEIGKAMREKNITHVIHVEDPSLWIHTKLAMTLAEFLPIEDDKKADLKLIMLYHDLGKTNPRV